MKAFCIDLDDNPYEIREFTPEGLAEEMAYCKAKSLNQLNNPDRRVFNSEDDAQAYIDEYKATLRLLDKRAPQGLKGRGMLLKRRYIVQAAHGEKTQTTRRYWKPWMPGDLFYFHDQVHFLTVRLTALRAEGGGNFTYEFERI